MTDRQAWLGLVAVVLLLLGGCVSGPPVYVVEEDDTLYSIAWKYELNWHRLARWNNIDPPYRIYPGQRLILTKPDNGTGVPRASEPPEVNKVASRASPAERETASVSHSHGNTREKETPTPAYESNPVQADGSVYDTGSIEWMWPVAASNIDRNGVIESRKGVDIHGDFGVPIRAASAGRVVYSGSGLEGYGNLLIIKHAGNYLSAYGFNSRLLVAEGEHVSAGDKIAEMGMGPGQSPMLHFEIRHDGQPLDVTGILPPLP